MARLCTLELAPTDRDPARNEGWMRREPRTRDIVCTKTRYRIEGRFGRLRRGPRMRDIPERCRRHTRAIIFSERGASGRPGRGFAHLLRLRRLSRPRQEQQQDDQQRPPHARSSPATPHILPTVPSRPSRELTASLLSVSSCSRHPSKGSALVLRAGKRGSTFFDITMLNSHT